MSFSDLRKNRTSSISSLQKQLESKTKFGTVDERFWKIQPDKAGNGYAVIRFLPPIEGETLPYVEMYNHAFQGPGGWYIENSRTTLGLEDPLAEYNRELWNSGDQSLKEQARKQYRKTSYYSNIYVVKDPANPENEGTVRLYRYGKKIYEMILNAVKGDELEGREGINPYCFWDGADFKLRVKKVSGYPNYDSSTFADPGTLEGMDDAQLESIWSRGHKLQELVTPDKFKSYDKLKERLDRVLGFSTGGSSSTARETVREAASASPVDVSAKPNFSRPASSPEPVSEDTSNSDLLGSSSFLSADSDTEFLTKMKNILEEED